jgi:ATP-dependent Lhr-like helicase
VARRPSRCCPAIPAQCRHDHRDAGADGRLVSARQAAQRSPGALRGGRILGQVEEYFLETLAPGDSFLFGGEVVQFEGIHEQDALVSRTDSTEPKIPSYAGGKFPLSTYLAAEVRRLLAEPESWSALPDQVADWLRLQQDKSALPGRDGLLVETFPRGGRHYMICYPFEGRLAHQTLGMLLTRRMERARAKPLGFVATDYALGVWGLADFGQKIAEGAMPLADLFSQAMLGDDLEEWMGESYLLKRTFRACALISGLVDRRHLGSEKSGRQVTVSTDLIYDVLRRHEPDHILLQATWADAASGLLDIARLGTMLARIEGRISHQRLTRISPLAVPIMLEVGKEPVHGEARDQVLEDAESLIEDALR